MSSDNEREAGVGRREMLKLAAAATVTASIGVSDLLAGQAAQARFFTPEEFRLLDELAEQIIPADEHSPGARAANVAAYIDGELAEAWTDEERAVWRRGLAAVDEVSRELAGRVFIDSAPGERLAVLTRLASKEESPETPAEQFFVTLKSRVAFAYYRSEIGIKQEMQYLGNTYLDEFVGYDVRTEKK